MYGGYPYSNSAFYINETIIGVVVGLAAVVMTGALLVKLALFVFRSLGLYKIARLRGIRGAWLAWVPVACDWVLGSVADQYRYVVKGRIKNRRLPLLLLGILVMVLQTVTNIASMELLISYARMMMGQIPQGVFKPTVIAYVLPAIAWCAAAARFVIHQISVYDLYSSCTVRYNVLYLVLGLVFRFLEPVFFFVCRNQEEGMPPRREEDVPVASEIVEDV